MCVFICVFVLAGLRVHHVCAAVQLIWELQSRGGLTLWRLLWLKVISRLSDMNGFALQYQSSTLKLSDVCSSPQYDSQIKCLIAHLRTRRILRSCFVLGINDGVFHYKTKLCRMFFLWENLWTMAYFFIVLKKAPTEQSRTLTSFLPFPQLTSVKPIASIKGVDIMISFNTAYHGLFPCFCNVTQTIIRCFSVNAHKMAPMTAVQRPGRFLNQ